MSWEDQGRQYHMWFGHGEAPPKDKPSEADTDDLFKPNNVGSRIDAIAHSALAHMPPADRRRTVTSFDSQRLERLRRAMTAWIGARSLSDATFAAKLTHPATGSAAIGKLRAAVEGVRTATTHQDLAEASVQLAGAMQDIGLTKWPGFLEEAAQRADAFGSGQGKTLLAQATPQNTATDASPGNATVAAPPPGRYVADNPRQWIGRPSAGTGECVALVQQATGAPLTADWRAGALAQGHPGVRAGTAIAVFDENGRYAEHAAIFLSQNANGLHVIDQWNNRGAAGITSQHTPSERTLPFNDPRHSLINRGESYRVIE